MTFTPGTVAEYDMVLAISQSAINAQFNILFNTPNPNDTTKNLIQKSITLGYKKYDSKTGTLKDSAQGVTAVIKCPTVDIANISPGGTPYRSIRLVLKMTSGTLTYYDEEDLKTLDLSGYTVSWVAQLSSKDIQNIAEEAMHPDAKTAITNALNELQGLSPDLFIVSSLFCLFESTQVSSSFQMQDDAGNIVQSYSQVGAFVNSLTVTYQHIDPGMFPYVLGYGISWKQKIFQDTAPAFCPAKFYFSTTIKAGNHSQNTINFLMINGEAHNDKLVDPTQNPSAGVLSSPFIDVTRAAQLGSDGILAISDSLFFRHWLTPEILNKFSFAEACFSGVSVSVETSESGGTGTPDASKSSTWSSGWIETGDLWTGYDRRAYSGSSTINIHYESVLQSQNNSGDIPTTTKRSVTVKVTGTVYNKVEFGHYFITGWGDEGYLDATTNWDFTLSITAADDGKWSVEKKTWNVPGTTTRGNHINALGYAEALSNFLDLSNLATFFTGLGDLPASAFDGVSAAIRGASTSFVMPGGDVYAFQGLDCDNAGNLYSHIKYKLVLAGSDINMPLYLGPVVSLN